MSRRNWLRTSFIGFGLFLVFGATVVLALPGDYCKICTDLGPYGGLTCLNVGSGWGFDNCEIKEVTDLIWVEGVAIGIRVKVCRVDSGCTLDY